MRLRLLSALTLITAMTAACGGDATTPGSGSATSGAPDPTTFAAQVASTDLVADQASRVQIGVFQSDPTEGVRLLTSGSVAVLISPVEGGEGTPVQTDAAYVPAPGTQGDASGQPVLSSPDLARGVYQADATLDAAGLWQAEVTFSVEGTSLTLGAAFEVGDEHALPAPGDRALRTENLTVETAEDLQALDSRAQDGAPLPDEELHEATIAGAIAKGRAALVLFATPVYCQSQFCGPTTDALQQLAAEGPTDVDFIHVEIWADYGASTLNQSATDWLLRDGDLTEPWLFLIDADGRIADRWGPLFDVGEVRAALDAL